MWTLHGGYRYRNRCAESIDATESNYALVLFCTEIFKSTSELNSLLKLILTRLMKLNCYGIT